MSFIAIASKGFYSPHCHLQLIVLPSLMLKPANVTHLWKPINNFSKYIRIRLFAAVDSVDPNFEAI